MSTKRPLGEDIGLACSRITAYLSARLLFDNRLEASKPPPLDLSHLDLRKLIMIRISLYALSGANFTGADLSGAYLGDAHLGNADLSGANLSGAYLSGANLSGANLSGAYLSLAHLNVADLSGADLSGTDLTIVHLNGANLSGANLSGANLLESDLSGANLSGATLKDVDLCGTILMNANLRGTQLTLSKKALGGNFKGVEGLEKAEFYTEDGKRVTGVTVDESGRLAPEMQETSDRTSQTFSTAAKDTVSFAQIYPDLLRRAQENGYVPPSPSPAAPKPTEP